MLRFRRRGSGSAGRANGSREVISVASTHFWYAVQVLGSLTRVGGAELAPVSFRPFRRTSNGLFYLWGSDSTRPERRSEWTFVQTLDV